MSMLGEIKQIMLKKVPHQQAELYQQYPQLRRNSENGKKVEVYLFSLYFAVFTSRYYTYFIYEKNTHNHSLFIIDHRFS